MTTRLPTIDVEEKVVVTFDFTADLGTASLSGSPVVSVTLLIGSDGTPGNIISGSGAIDGTGKKVLVPVAPTVSPADYRIKVRCSTSDSGVRLVMKADLSVR